MNASITRSNEGGNGMKRPLSMLVLVLATGAPAALAQTPNVTLHVNPKWRSCAIQLDPALTQDAWRRFTEEAAVLTYFRPLTDARPIGRGNFEVSIAQWQTKVDETSSAWNDTFVHPDSTHWLTEGSGLGIPGLLFRAGITDKIDVGAYVTKNVESNYGLWGGQIQYNLMHQPSSKFAVSTRLSLVSLYGPDDVDLTVYGMDIMASKTAALTKRLSVSPYVGFTTMLSNAHEKSPMVSLNDETAWGAMGTAGAVAQYSIARLGVEYNVANVNTLSLKVGVAF